MNKLRYTVFQDYSRNIKHLWRWHQYQKCVYAGEPTDLTQGEIIAMLTKSRDIFKIYVHQINSILEDVKS